MNSNLSHLWTQLTPPFRSAHSKSMYLEFARKLVRTAKGADSEARGERLDACRLEFVRTVQRKQYQDGAALLAAGLVVADLVVQGWPARVRNRTVEVRPPLASEDGHAGEKTRVRQQ